MKRKKIIGIILGIINGVLFLILIEIAVRIYDKERPFLPPAAPEWIIFSPTLHYTMKPGFGGEIYKTAAEINSQGFRGQEFNPEKGDTFRVVCMGNSSTFGNGVKVEDTYPYILEQRLKGKYGEKVQVINAGVPGYSSFQGEILWSEKIADFKPDVVVVSYGFNDRRTVPDSGWTDGGDFFRRDAKVQARMRFFSKSYLWRWLLHLLNLDEKVPEITGFIVRVDKDDYEANLRGIGEKVQAAGGKVLFLGVPDRNNLHDFCREVETAMVEGEYQKGREMVEKSNNLYSRMMRRRFNLLADSLQAEISRVAEWPDVMAFHGGLPIYTAEEYNAAMRTAAEALKADYIDLSGKLGEEDYLDFIHFNQSGAEKAARMLEERIMAGKKV